MMMTETLAQIHNHKFRKHSGSTKLKDRDVKNNMKNNNNVIINNNNNNNNISTEKNNNHFNMNGNTGFVKMGSVLNMYPHLQQDQMKRGGSFVVGQKLRESKWFCQNEMNIFCAVVETGFIVEQKNEIEDEISQFGVAIWTPGFEKSKNPDMLTIYTLSESKGKMKVCAKTVREFWPEETRVRINNKCDKTEKPLSEDIIRNQIIFTEHSRRKWHNSEHYAYFCRYGPQKTVFKAKKITDQLKWTTEMFFLNLKTRYTK